MKQRSYQRSDLQSTQCFIYSPSRNKYFLYSKTIQFLYGPDIRWHMGTWLSHNWPKNSLVTLALWMICAAAVIMQLLSPQDWLDGIQAPLLVITIFPVFVALFVACFVQDIRFVETLSKFNEDVVGWQFKACEDRNVGALFISTHLEKLYPTFVIKFPEKKYGKIWSMSLNSELHHLKGHFFRGAVQFFFWVNLGFCPNRLDPPPPPRTLGHQQLKKNFDVYFAF